MRLATPRSSQFREAYCGAVRALALALAAVSVAATACDDPLAHLDQAKKAFQQGANRGPDAAAAGRSGSQGISLGAGHAKRLYYQFVDATGQVRFVERMNEVPEQWRARVGYVEMDSPPPLSPRMAENTREQRFQQVAEKYRKVARKPAMQKIVLYSADWCGWCKKAKRHLDGKGIDYEVRDIDHPQNLQELVAKTGQKGIPVLDVGGRVVTGFSKDRYDDLIDG